MKTRSELSEAMKAVCVREDAHLIEALKVIDRGRCEVAFVVAESGRVLGVITDGDARRALLRGKKLDEACVTDVMTREFKWVADVPDHRARALDIMLAHSVKQVPVLDPERRIIGLHVMEEYLSSTTLPNPVLVLAGGKGRRLRPLTESIPKPMVRVAGRPILERLLLGLVGAGFENIHLSVNYLHQVIEDYFGDGSDHGCRITYLVEESPLGTGGPLRLLPEPQRPVLVLNGDLVGDFRFADLMRYHEERDCAMTVGVGIHRYMVPYGVVEHDQGVITGVVEKPEQDWWINQGVYVVSPELIERIPSEVEYPITDLMRDCLEAGLKVGAFELGGEWQDVGRPEDWLRANGRL